MNKVSGNASAEFMQFYIIGMLGITCKALFYRQCYICKHTLIIRQAIQTNRWARFDKATQQDADGSISTCAPVLLS